MALTLALASTSVHAVGAVRGGERGLLYLLMAAGCTACAVMTLRAGRIGDWFVMGIINAAMVSAHVLLMSGADASMAHLSLAQHLAYHARGHGFDVAHLGGGFAVLEVALSLYVLTSHALGRRRPTTGQRSDTTAPTALTRAAARRPG